MEGEIARGGGVDGVNVQQCLTCLTGSWPSPCLSACLLPHRWDRIHLMSNYITSAPRCHRCALSSASVCVCVHISYTLSSPRARRITAFEFAFPCTTCSSVLYFTVFKIESAGGKHKTQTKARRLIRERWKPPPPLVLLCRQTRRERERRRGKRGALMCLVRVKASRFWWWQHEGSAAQTKKRCSVFSRRQKMSDISLSLFLPLPFSLIAIYLDSCAREFAAEVV